MSNTSSSPIVVRTIGELRETVDTWRRDGEKIALVPTMGALHEGHLSLVDIAHKHAGKVIVTIFINPTQFGPGEDLDAYPRDEAGDRAKLSAQGVDLIFAPERNEIYPPGFATRITVDGLTDCLCGRVRPGHFDGVATIVAKLLNQARADVAIFGEKDFQQLLVITRLSYDLDISTKIIGAPIIREADGLALSSRNVYLSGDERKIAGRFNQVLRDAVEALKQGQSIGAVLGKAQAELKRHGVTRIDYLEIRDAQNLTPYTITLAPDARARIFGAIFIGKTRLIDNMAIA